MTLSVYGVVCVISTDGWIVPPGVTAFGKPVIRMIATPGAAAGGGGAAVEVAVGEYGDGDGEDVGVGVGVAA